MLGITLFNEAVNVGILLGLALMLAGIVGLQAVNAIGSGQHLSALSNWILDA